MRKGFSASAIFTGDQWLLDRVIVVNDGMIEQIVSAEEVSDLEIRQFDGQLIVPAFVDVQVYGAAERLLAVYPEANTLQLMYEDFSRQGTALFLPTVATNTEAVFRKCIDAVRAYWEKGGGGVVGLHLEGPWLNDSKKGAHVSEWIHAPAIAEVRELLHYGRDVIRMITIAPEVCSDEVIEYLGAQNIILSAGHSNATYAEAYKAFDKGVHAVTHLYNAMSPLQHRAPGLVGAAFNHSTVMASIIPDGHHVDYAAIRIAKKQMGERLFAITDAVTKTTVGPYQHELAGDKYECNGVLSGSALSMYDAFLNLVKYAGIEVDEALRMCSTYPARVLGVDNRYGKIVPQAAGQFLVLNKQLGLEDVILL